MRPVFTSSFLMALLSVQNAFASAEHDFYSKVFPFHAQYCALSQVKPVNEEPGGIGGHAVLYVEGLCKDAHATYPKVLPCSQVSEKERDHTGVGISVNKDFKNVNWVAIPGYDLFAHGITPNAGHVDQKAIDEVIREVLEKRAYAGLRAKDGISKFAFGTQEYERDVATSALATDYAIQFGRDSKCVRIPLPESALGPMAEYLNSRNKMYAESEDKNFEYHWSMLFDNCSHVSANALAAIGVRDEIKVNRSFLAQLGNIAVPRNGLSTLQEIVHHAKIDFKSVYGDGRRWNALSEMGFLPTGFGALSIQFLVYPENDFYETNLKALSIPAKPLLKAIGIWNRSKDAFTDPRFSDLAQNATYWLEQYDHALHKSQKYIESEAVLRYRAVITQEVAKTKAALSLFSVATP